MDRKRRRENGKTGEQKSRKIEDGKEWKKLGEYERIEQKRPLVHSESPSPYMSNMLE